jgi:hypothetical protein
MPVVDASMVASSLNRAFFVLESGFVLTPVPLLIHEHGQTFFEAELSARDSPSGGEWLPAIPMSFINKAQCRLHQHDVVPPED